MQIVTTLQSYFEGKKDLFKGLAIERLEKEWTEYPVLHFDMSDGKHMGNEQLDRYLDFVLAEQEKCFDCVCRGEDPNLRLINLISTAYEKTGRQVVVLIDEYDAPMLDVAHEQEQLQLLSIPSTSPTRRYAWNCTTRSCQTISKVCMRRMVM